MANYITSKTLTTSNKLQIINLELDTDREYDPTFREYDGDALYTDAVRCTYTVPIKVIAMERHPDEWGIVLEVYHGDTPVLYKFLVARGNWYAVDSAIKNNWIGKLV